VAVIGFAGGGLRARRLEVDELRVPVAHGHRVGDAPRAWLVYDVEADVCELTANGWWVLYRDELIVGSVRQVIALRVHERDLAGRPFRLCHVAARWGGVLLPTPAAAGPPSSASDVRST